MILPSNCPPPALSHVLFYCHDSLILQLDCHTTAMLLSHRHAIAMLLSHRHAIAMLPSHRHSIAVIPPMSHSGQCLQYGAISRYFIMHVVAGPWLMQWPSAVFVTHHIKQKKQGTSSSVMAVAVAITCCLAWIHHSHRSLKASGTAMFVMQLPNEHYHNFGGL